ncbi:hypothetical protein CMUS01_12981 [Colletotrichum musicola]|uniref:Uncharacterized protein n=1 Tax=Colletotrichum musicola TaxID=2175873 RepID=A0A8H6MYD2_9PEZI|nr:hypothetical protein CMUS01_12981 [Colletotrichum musicola]
MIDVGCSQFEEEQAIVVPISNGCRHITPGAITNPSPVAIAAVTTAAPLANPSGDVAPVGQETTVQTVDEAHQHDEIEMHVCSSSEWASFIWEKKAVLLPICSTAA